MALARLAIFLFFSWISGTDCALKMRTFGSLMLIWMKSGCPATRKGSMCTYPLPCCTQSHSLCETLFFFMASRLVWLASWLHCIAKAIASVSNASNSVSFSYFFHYYMCYLSHGNYRAHERGLVLLGTSILRSHGRRSLVPDQGIDFGWSQSFNIFGIRVLL